MALNLIKLTMSASATNTATAGSTQYRYFYTVDAADISSGTLTIANTKFENDSGTALTAAFQTVTPGTDGYYELLYDGVPQKFGLVTVASNGLSVEVTDAAGMTAGVPITFIVTKFVPTVTSTITVTT
jgi:hypothetical protein